MAGIFLFKAGFNLMEIAAITILLQRDWNNHALKCKSGEPFNRVNKNAAAKFSYSICEWLMYVYYSLMSLLSPTKL